MLELTPKQHLREHVCWILTCVHLHKRNVAFLNDISHKMIPDVDMLGSSMMNLILCQMNSTLSVTPQVHLVLLNTRIT